MANIKRNPNEYETGNTYESGYPFVIERKLKGLATMSIVFLFAGLALLAFTKSILGAALGAFLAVLVWILRIMLKRQLETSGFEIWHFHVMEYTHLTKLNRKPTGFYAEALDGPYEGHVCHIALSNKSITPHIDSDIQLFVPGDLIASPVRDVYYIPQYYGMTTTQATD